MSVASSVCMTMSSEQPIMAIWWSGLSEIAIVFMLLRRVVLVFARLLSWSSLRSFAKEVHEPTSSQFSFMGMVARGISGSREAGSMIA